MSKKHIQKSQKVKKSKLKQTLSIKRFTVTYLVLMTFFFLLIAVEPIQNVIDLNGLYTKAIVSVTAKILEIMGMLCTCKGSVITISGISLDIKFGCNGLEAVMIYTIGIISFPATWKKKFLGIIAGFIVIQIINIIRIVALAYSCIYFKTFFEYIHIYIAQGMMIAVALGIYLLWINYAKKGS
ncbi:MAG: exosortase H [Deltaproteobacteria bacterium]|nr:exosortase H [Deltaproteobacteria bacterium]MBW1718637.1 exosortase H [Deltaproteobacteria bacterium]MBW1932909.1 exosortase H [Deltaproteobacteria bacterium]MBW1938567.1 exosortase H [Deltaproteobacteria bacterium]MBW1964141.1 exosortase H [Deltaproteobacteria bacterium]